MILDLVHLPPGWSLTHLVLLDPEWQANIHDDEHVAVGTGATPEDAIAAACAKIEAEDFAGRLFSLDHALVEGPRLSLVERLGLLKPKPVITRRI